MPLAHGFPDYTGATIDSGRLLLEAQAGAGGAGVVYRAIDLSADPSSPRTYAVKWQGLLPRLRDAPPAQRANYMARLANEADLHARVSAHPHVLTLHRVIEDEARECRWLVLDWAPGGDMFGALTERNWWWRDDAKTRAVVRQLVGAVRYCHAQGVYHRDIKPENIMINADGSQVFLADFGVATTDRFSEQWRVGTTAYQAPELLDSSFLRLRRRAAYSCARADAWALAVTVFNLLVAAAPWPAATKSTDNSLAADARHGFPLARAPAALLTAALGPEPAARTPLAQFAQRAARITRWYPTLAEVARAGPGACEYVAFNDWCADAARRHAAAQQQQQAEQDGELETGAAAAAARADQRSAGSSACSSLDSLSSAADSSAPVTPDALPQAAGVADVSVLDLNMNLDGAAEYPYPNTSEDAVEVAMFKKPSKKGSNLKFFRETVRRVRGMSLVLRGLRTRSRGNALVGVVVA